MTFVSCVCGEGFRAKPELAGQQVPCPFCGEMILIPSDSLDNDLADLQPPPSPRGDPLGLGETATQHAWSGGYGRPSYTPPRQKTPPSSGAGKTAKSVASSIGIAVAGVAGIAAIVGVFFLWGKLFGESKIESLIDQATSVAENILDIMGTIQDEETAQAAAAEILPLARKLRALEQEMDDIPAPSVRAVNRAVKKLIPRTAAIDRRMPAALRSVMRYPVTARQVIPALQDVTPFREPISKLNSSSE